MKTSETSARSDLPIVHERPSFAWAAILLCWGSSLLTGVALPPITHWTGGNGSFYDAGKWSDGVPGLVPVGDENFSLTQFTGPWYSWSDVTINNGTASIVPSLQTVYNVYGDPDGRYSVPYLVTNNPAFTTLAVLGESATATGTANISGANSRWDVGSLTIGNQGRGEIRVDTGGNLAATAAVMANATGSSALLEINAGGNVQLNGIDHIVGNYGQGTVRLSEGGILRVGSSGNGGLTLRRQVSGVGILEIGTGGLPGTLQATTIWGFYPGRGKAVVRVNHQDPNYTLAAAMEGVDLNLSSGNIGTTTLTAPESALAFLNITSGGLRLAQGAYAFTNSEIVVGDGGIIDMDNYSLPFLEVDGPGTAMDALFGITVGKDGDGEVRLKNGGKLTVRDTTHQAQNALILGDEYSPYGRNCSVIFGGSSTTAPGILDAASIYSYASTGSVIFNHSSSACTLNSWLDGALAVKQIAGTTLLSGGYLGYSGTTSVSGGTLLVASNLASVVSVGNGATFGGKGTTARVNAASGSTLSPGTFRAGDGIAALRITVLNLFGGSKIRIDMGPGLACDRILNHQNASVVTTLFPVTSGNITFEFRNKGIDQTGVYPVLTTSNIIVIR